MGTGDVISQTLVEKQSEQFDWIRTAKFTGLGLLAVGPTLRLWYGVLDRYIVYTGAKGTLMKVATDQLLFAPTFVAAFMSTIALLNGESVDKIKTRLEQDYCNVLTTNWKVWPLFQTVNFYFVPLQHRVLAAQIVALFWNVYLSFITNRVQAQEIES